jgi:hypothetical protein
MTNRAAHGTVPPPRSDNQRRNEPRLPGTSIPAPGAVPLAYIYQPAPSPTQSGRARSEWVLEFELASPPEIEPLMGWIGSRDPFAHIRLRFPDRQSAIEFAERQGWPYVVEEPPPRRFRPKSYADNFRYDVADAIIRAGRPWEGQLSISSPDRADAAHGAAPARAAASFHTAVGRQAEAGL